VVHSFSSISLFRYRLALFDNCKNLVRNLAGHFARMCAVVYGITCHIHVQYYKLGTLNIQIQSLSITNYTYTHCHQNIATVVVQCNTYSHNLPLTPRVVHWASHRSRPQHWLWHIKPSAAEVMTLWRYRSSIIITIISWYCRCVCSCTIYDKCR